MSQLPADPPLPSPPPGRWPQFSEIRGLGRKVSLAFLLLISAAGFLGVILNILLDVNWVSTSIEFLPLSTTVNHTAQAALDCYVAVSCFILLKSRRRSRSWRSLAVLLGMAMVSGVLNLGLLLMRERDYWEVIVGSIVIVFKIGCPLLVMGALLGLQWLPLTGGMRKRDCDGRSPSNGG